MFSSTRRALMQRLFPALEGLIYARFLFLDLTGRGAAGNGLKYLGILLCALFAWYQARGGGSRLMAWALTLTLGADWFLLMLDRYYALGLLLFCGASVYVELCLHLCVYRSMDRRAVYLVLFGLLGGTV